MRRIWVAALALGAAVALAGCGPDRAAPATPAPAGPAVGELERHEATVDDLERVVGSAEADAETDAETGTDAETANDG